MASCRRSRRRPHAAWAALLTAALATGCGEGGVAVTGHVAFDDQPIAAGTITFLPDDDPTTVDPATVKRIQSPIVDGAFAVESGQGLLPGRYRVAIRAKRVAGQTPADERSSEMVDRYEQYIPAQYNSRTELVAEIDADDADPLQFELTSPPRPGRRRR